MFNALQSKFKSLLFTPPVSNSRKRKRALDESNDQDCEIIEVKRPKNNPGTSHLGYNFFSKMADWVKNKTSWDSMFDFRPKNERRKKYEDLQQEDSILQDGTVKHQGDIRHGGIVKHSGNGVSAKTAYHVGERKAIHRQQKGDNKPVVRNPAYNNMDGGSNCGQIENSCVVNGDGRNTPPCSLGYGASQHSEPRKSYAAAVKSSKDQNNINITAQANGHLLTQDAAADSNKKKYHFTVDDTIDLAEKERYKMLLQQFTTIPMVKSHEKSDSTLDSWPSLEKSVVERRNESVIFRNQSGHYSTTINISNSREVPRYRMKPRNSQPLTESAKCLTNLVDSITSPSTGTSVIHSPSPGTSVVHSPTSVPVRPLLESTRVAEPYHTRVNESYHEPYHPKMSKPYHEPYHTRIREWCPRVDKSSTKKADKSYPTKAAESQKERATTQNSTIVINDTIRDSNKTCDFRNSQYLSKNWALDRLSAYSSSVQDKKKRIAEAEIKVKICDERRQEQVDDIEKSVRLRMRLSEREPAVIEDLPVQVEEFDEEKAEEMPEITPAMDDIINKALRGQPAGEVLVEGYRLQITRGDIATLAGLNWLNDEVINFYMNMLMERGEKGGFPKCFAFNTFFYPKIMSGGQSSVRRWTKKVDIFSYDYVIIPVHLGMHWCLCMIDFKQKSIKYYDSMGGNNIKCLNAVKQYLCDECKDKKNQQFDTNGWKTEVVENIPQQMNGSDCGMFACKFAEYITRGARITFSQQHMPYFRRRMVYEIVTKKLLQ